MDNNSSTDLPISQRIGEILQVLSDQFPIKIVSLNLVNESENLTFQAKDSAGGSYVLRLHRPRYHTQAELLSERVWIRALAAAGFAVPLAIPASDGREYAEMRIDPSHESRYVGLTHWVEGELLADVLDREIPAAEASAAEPQIQFRFRQLGQVIAKLHGQASNWQVPTGFDRHRLDADGLMGEQPFWGRFWEHPGLSEGQGQVLCAARHQLFQELQALPQDPRHFSIIHADLHPYNLLVTPEGQLNVIDFDDAGFGWHLYDLVVALAMYRTRWFFPIARQALLDGYRSHRSLTNEDKLPTFQLVRRLATLGWGMQRPELGPNIDQAGIEQLVEDCQAYLASFLNS